MQKLLTIAVLSVAALGLGAGQASAGLFGCFGCGGCGCCYKVTLYCKQPNAFSPFCCYPCGHKCPPGIMNMGNLYQPGCYGGGCGGCADGSCGASVAQPMMAQPGAAMPPSGPTYMPPAPTPADAQSMRPMMPYGTMPVAYPPMYAPNYAAMQGYGMPQMQMQMPMQQMQMQPMPMQQMQMPMQQMQMQAPAYYMGQ